MSKFSVLKNLAGDSLIYGVSGVISRFISIFLVPVYTRIFTPDDYGVISLVTTLFALLSILVILGMDNSVARWFYDDENDRERQLSLNTFLWSCFAFAFAFAALIVIFSEQIAASVLQEPKTLKPLLIAALNLPLTVFITFTTNILRIQRRAAAASLFSVSIALLTIALNILFVVVLKTGVIGVFYAQLLTSIIAVAWTLILFGKLLNPRYFEARRWLEMFKFSFPLIPGSIAFWIINFSGVYFIQSFETSREVGLYQIGISMASAMALLTNAFQMAWGPFAFSIHKQDDAREIYADSLLIYLGITCSIGVLITIFAKEALMILTTVDYYEASAVAGILSFNYLIIGLSYIASIGTNLAKNNRAYGISSVVSAFLLIILNVLLVPKFGIEGAATATLASQIIIPFAVFWHGQKIYRIPYDFSKASLIFTTSLAAAFATNYFLEITDNPLLVEILIKICIVVIYFSGLFYLFDLKPYFKTFLAKSRPNA